MKELQPRPGKRRLNVDISDTERDGLDSHSDFKGKTVAATLRQFIDLGLILYPALTRGAVLVERHGDQETEYLIV